MSWSLHVSLQFEWLDLLHCVLPSIFIVALNCADCYTNISWAQRCAKGGGSCFPTNIGVMRWKLPESDAHNDAHDDNALDPINAAAGPISELLYNGIVLPEQWPPRINLTDRSTLAEPW